MGKCISANSDNDSGNNTDNKKDCNDKAEPLNKHTNKETNAVIKSSDNDNNNSNVVVVVDKTEPKDDDNKSSQSPPIPVEQTGSLSDDDDDDDDDNNNKKYIKNKNKKNKKKDQGNILISSSSDKKEENNFDLSSINYISPNSDEIASQIELNLAHICHRGHYQNKSENSAQNMLQTNSSNYKSLKTNDFNYDTTNKQDWFIFKIISNNIIKLTSFRISNDINSDINQYPKQISIQLLSTNSLLKVINNANNESEWTKTYSLSNNGKYPFITTKPVINDNDNDNEHSDSFNISYDDTYLKSVTGSVVEQYIRVNFLESTGDIANDLSKYCLNNITFFGVSLDDLQLNNDLNSKNYKVNCSNKFKSLISPSPGVKDARILMREHIFFINIESKTISNIKQTICDEYCSLMNGNKSYQPKELLLMEEKYGLINDMLDATILNKTLNDIGAKPQSKTVGYFITVAFC